MLGSTWLRRTLQGSSAQSGGVGEVLPDFWIDRDAETKVFFAEVERLFAGIADGVGGVGGSGLVEIVDDVVGDVG